MKNAPKCEPMVKITKVPSWKTIVLNLRIGNSSFKISVYFLIVVFEKSEPLKDKTKILTKIFIVSHLVELHLSVNQPSSSS